MRVLPLLRRSLKAAVPECRLTTARYQQVVAALNFVQNDGSFGIHNYAYTDALLSAAEQDLALLSGSVTPDANARADGDAAAARVVIVESSSPETRLPAASARLPSS